MSSKRSRTNRIDQVLRRRRKPLALQLLPFLLFQAYKTVRRTNPPLENEGYKTTANTGDTLRMAGATSTLVEVRTMGGWTIRHLAASREATSPWTRCRA